MVGKTSPGNRNHQSKLSIWQPLEPETAGTGNPVGFGLRLRQPVGSHNISAKGVDIT